MEAREQETENGTRLGALEQWQRGAAPAVERLIRDQDYRDQRIANRDVSWRRWSIRVAVGAGAVAVTGTLVRATVELIHLF